MNAFYRQQFLDLICSFKNLVFKSVAFREIPFLVNGFASFKNSELKPETLHIS